MDLVNTRPRWRGRLHQVAFIAWIPLGVALVALGRSGTIRAATAVYAVSLIALYGISATYHLVTWKPKARALMRRLDHSTILLLIAGTYTPFALLAFEGATADAILVTVWVGAAAGLVLNLAWVDAPKWLTAGVFIALGWVGVVALPQMFELGVAPATLVIVGGALYTLGALAYALRRPDPAPAVFGYHEVFHLLVIGAAAAHFVAIAAFVLPQA